MYNRIARGDPGRISDTISIHQRCSTPIEALTDFFTNLSPKGRSSRADFWWVILFVNFPHGILTSYFWSHPSRVFGIFMTVFSCYLLWVDYCLFTRRAHDSGRGDIRSQVWLAGQILLFVAVIMIKVLTYRILTSLILGLIILNFIIILFIAVVGLFKSSPRTNKFGPVPHLNAVTKNTYSSYLKKKLSASDADRHLEERGAGNNMNKLIAAGVCGLCFAIIIALVMNAGFVDMPSGDDGRGNSSEEYAKHNIGANTFADYELGQVLDFGDDFMSYADDFAKAGVKLSKSAWNTYFKEIDVEDDESFSGMKGFSRLRIGASRFYENGIARCKVRSIHLETNDLPKWKRLQTVNKYTRILEKKFGVRFKCERHAVSIKDEEDEYILATAGLGGCAEIRVAAFAPLEKFVCVILAYTKEEGSDKEDAETVFRYRKAANQGDVDAQYNLGLCYEIGRGVEKDAVAAVHWYRKAAGLGDVRALYKMGFCYETGRGVERDKMAATRWYRMSADNGCAEAQYTLGLWCEDGDEDDKKDALRWFRKAADQGHAGAHDKLGDCYNYGRDTLCQDVREAQKWYRKAVDVYLKAAEMGDAEAQAELGRHYECGLGVEKNYQEAQRWYRKAVDVYGNAAVWGDADAQYHLGLCYEYGRGVAVDKEEAKFWLLKAAEQGSSSAAFSLKYGDL